MCGHVYAMVDCMNQSITCRNQFFLLPCGYWDETGVIRWQVPLPTELSGQSNDISQAAEENVYSDSAGWNTL